jgi:hypothetical protein
MATSVPRWLTNETHRGYWRRPWTVPTDPRKAAGFKKLLREHGYLSPHFKISEAACHDPARTPVPKSKVRAAQRHAFNLERLRHRLGDRSLPILSWYRTPAWNHHVGGVEDSQHLDAVATDFTVQTVNSFGASRFDQACEDVFENGGFGRYPTGSRHVDSRGSRARW